MTLEQLVASRRTKGLYASCDNCMEQTYVSELEIDEYENVTGICDTCFNTVTVTRDDLEHAGKSF